MNGCGVGCRVAAFQRFDLAPFEASVLRRQIESEDIAVLQLRDVSDAVVVSSSMPSSP